MKKNVGSIDKIVRVIIAIIAAYFAYTKEFESAWIAYVLWAVAIIMLVTALFGRCGLYSVCGANTCKLKNKEE